MADDRVALVANKCPLCGTEESHAIPQEGYWRWKRGELVQKALPELNECIREFLITGFCAECRAENDRVTAGMENDTDEDNG